MAIFLPADATLGPVKRRFKRFIQIFLSSCDLLAIHDAPWDAFDDCRLNTQRDLLPF